MTDPWNGEAGCENSLLDGCLHRFHAHHARKDLDERPFGSSARQCVLPDPGVGGLCVRDQSELRSRDCPKTSVDGERRGPMMTRLIGAK